MRHVFQRLTRSRPQPITIVSGLPRSGTSMMMKMLEAGGMPVLTDELREADVDNPRGYYEFEPVKQLPKGDTAWVADAQGKAVKVIAALLKNLPAGYSYRVLFMHRNLKEVLASQRRMLIHRGEDPDKVEDSQLMALFDGHVREVKAWMVGQSNFSVLDVDYNEMLRDPEPLVRQINRFLDKGLDEDKMVGAVDPQLHRNRA